MEIENNSNSNNNNNKKEILLERSGQEPVTIKLADNSGKTSETAKKKLGPRRTVRFKKTLGRRNYIGNRNKVGGNRKKDNRTDYNKRNRRQRGVGIRRRGVKIIVRNLTRNATNQDIRSIFEKIGPLKRCGINWNNLGESKGTAEVEYHYRRDAFKACRKLDYKSIRGVPIRLEMREGLKRIVLRSRGRSGGLDNRRTRSFGVAKRFRAQRNFSREGRRRRRNLSAKNGVRKPLRNRSIRKRLSIGRRRGDRKNNFKK